MPKCRQSWRLLAKLRYYRFFILMQSEQANTESFLPWNGASSLKHLSVNEVYFSAGFLQAQLAKIALGV